MWFQKLLTFVLIYIVVRCAWKYLGIGEYIKFEKVDNGSSEVSEVEKSILELEFKKQCLLEVEQNIEVTRRARDIDKKLNLLTKKYNKLKGGS